MKKKIIQITIALLLFSVAIVFKFSNSLINNIIFVISYLIVGLEIVLKALKNIKRGKVFDENFLMTIATIGAFIIGEFPEAVAVMLFYQVGELFQNFAINKSRKSIAELMDLRPDYANVKRDGSVIKVSPNEVAINEIIIVKPGERVPLDGVLVNGNSLIDTSALTGESLPTNIAINDEILSGCINKTEVIEIKTTKTFKESTLNKILDLVENASSKKSNSERFITKFSKYYTPIVVIIATLLALIPPLFTGTYNEWLYRSLTFLVISCPCALVISVPLSFFGGIGGASRLGILIKGGNYLESLAHTEVVVFDKTGTLTEGKFCVDSIIPTNISEDELLFYAVHAEKFSNHPISNSLKDYYKKKIDENIVSNIKEISGMGIKAKINNKNILVGNKKLMEKYYIDFNISTNDKTVIYIAIDNIFAGYITISDKLKYDSPLAIQSLKKMGIKKIIMLTGDKKEISNKISNALSIDEIYAELLPIDKVNKMESILKEKNKDRKVVFVGDGINDAPALALSDIGIAMGGLGSDAAIEAADIVIMTDEPSKVGKAIEISKKTLRIVKQNIWFAISIKIAVLLLSAFGLSTMWEAIFADVGVSILAILNSLRMLKVK